MPRDGSGTYTHPVGTTAVTNTDIESVKYNAMLTDVADALNNIWRANIRSADLTGLDAKLVTGTAAADGQLAKWNADGDLIDAGVNVLDEDNMASNSATSVPTQQSVKAYVDSRPAAGMSFLGATILLDADADTGIKATTDDTIEFTTGGSDIGSVTSGSLYHAVRLEVGYNSGTPSSDMIKINSAAGYDRDIAWRTNGYWRWKVRVNSTAESGSNVGSDFQIRAYDDAGNFLNTALTINRSDSTAIFGGSVDLDSNKLILDADEDTWLQSTGDDYYLWKAGNQTISEHGYAASAYHYFYGAINLYTTKFAPSTLTISSGAVTASRSHHRIDTEGAAATDDLTTINGVADGMFLFLRPANAARTVVIKEGGNIYLQGGSDIVLDDYRDICCLWSDGSYWYEVFRPSDGGGSSSEWNYATPVNVTAVSAITFTGLTGAKEIEIFLENVNYGSAGRVRIGDAGGLETTGYQSGSAGVYGTSGSSVGDQTGFALLAPYTLGQNGVISLHSAATDEMHWACRHSIGMTTYGAGASGGGFKTLSDVLTQLSIGPASGNFTAGGTIHLRWR